MQQSLLTVETLLYALLAAQALTLGPAGVALSADAPCRGAPP